MNDGSEARELYHSNLFELTSLRTKLYLSFALLQECRALLEVVFDTQLHSQIQALIKKIDSFKGD